MRAAINAQAMPCPVFALEPPLLRQGRVPTTATSVATDTLIANRQELFADFRLDSSQIDSRRATTYRDRREQDG